MEDALEHGGPDGAQERASLDGALEREGLDDALKRAKGLKRCASAPITSRARAAAMAPCAKCANSFCAPKGCSNAPLGRISNEPSRMRPNRASTLFPLLLLLALAAASLWLERAVQAPERDQSGKLRHDPD